MSGEIKRGKITQKWRPSLALVIGGTLAAVLAAPTAGVLVLRVLGDEIGFRQSVLVIGLGVLWVTLVLGYLLWRLLLGPMRRLTAQSEAFAAGKTAPYNPQSHYGTRELQELGQTVLDMAEGLHNRQETVRTYTNHVTHELKSPLTAIIGAAELLEDAGLEAAQRARLLATITQSSARMQALLEGLRRIAEAREPLGQGTCSLKTVLTEIGAEYGALEITVTGGDMPLNIPPAGLEVILRQMLGNALAHGAGQVWLDVVGTDGLQIKDNGSGISAGNRARIFEPFFTTRRENGGTGMGLAIVQSLLEVRGGKIEVQDCAQGAAFKIWF